MFVLICFFIVLSSFFFSVVSHCACVSNPWCVTHPNHWPCVVSSNSSSVAAVTVNIGGKCHAASEREE